MAWINSFKRKSNNGSNCTTKIMLYVQKEEKELLKKRAAEKNQSISYYLRAYLKPRLAQLKGYYEDKEKQE